MRRLSVIIVIFISVLFISGCQKAQNGADSKVVADMPSESQQSKDTTNADNPQASCVPVKVDFESGQMPDLCKTVTHKETNWGVIERTTLHLHDDITIYYEIPVLKGDSQGIKKINDLMKSQRDSFFSEDSLKAFWNVEAERHKKAGTSDVLVELYDFHEVSVVYVPEKFVSVAFTNRTWLDEEISEINALSYDYYNFDMTGEPLKLSALYHKSDGEIKNMIIDALKQSIKEKVEYEKKEDPGLNDKERIAELEDYILWYLNGLDNFDKYYSINSDGRSVREPLNNY